MAVQAVHPAASKNAALAMTQKPAAPPQQHKQAGGGFGGAYNVSISKEAKATATASVKAAPVAAKK